MKTRKKFYYFYNGVRFTKQKELAEVLNVNPRTVATKVFRAAKQDSKTIELNNNFVKLLTKQEAAEQALTYKFI